jgi:hypothetical protein
MRCGFLGIVTQTESAPFIARKNFAAFLTNKKASDFRQTLFVIIR